MVSMFTELQGELKINEPLSQHTSWRVGGIAKRFYQPKDKNDLASFLRQLPADEPLLWLGLGSNLLIRDGGFAGTVISMAGTMQALDIDDQRVTAEVGVYCSKVAKQSAKQGLSGAAFLAGIPGTFGGALAMNAGAHAWETWQLVKEATTVTRQGELKKRSASDFKVAYRHVELPEKEWFVSATLELQLGDAETETALIKLGDISLTRSLNLGSNSAKTGINSSPISSFNCLSSAATNLLWLAKLAEVLSKSPI